MIGQKRVQKKDLMEEVSQLRHYILPGCQPDIHLSSCKPVIGTEEMRFLGKHKMEKNQMKMKQKPKKQRALPRTQESALAYLAE